MTVGLLWTPRSTNRKTGDLPTCFIGKSRKESLQSCKGCPLLHEKDGGQARSGRKMCNSQYGTQALGHMSYVRKFNKGVDLSLKRALENRLSSARYARFAALGEPSVLPLKTLKGIVETIRGEGMGFLSYTHFWYRYRDGPKGRFMRENFMASCNSIDEIDEALGRGWNATAIVEPGHPGGFQWTPEGHPAILCPHTLNPMLQCNLCGLCDLQKNASTAILFWDMGATAHGKRRRIRELTAV